MSAQITQRNTHEENWYKTVLLELLHEVALPPGVHVSPWPPYPHALRLGKKRKQRVQRILYVRPKIIVAKEAKKNDKKRTSKMISLKYTTRKFRQITLAKGIYLFSKNIFSKRDKQSLLVSCNTWYDYCSPVHSKPKNKAAQLQHSFTKGRSEKTIQKRHAQCSKHIVA